MYIVNGIAYTGEQAPILRVVGVGGGTLAGLCSRLCGTRKYDQIVKLAAGGDVNRVDLTVGDITRVLAEKFRIPPERAACLLDTFSCLAQGTLPYGAQLLMAARLSGLNVAQIIPELTYPMLLGACALISIFLPGRTASAASRKMEMRAHAPRSIG